MHAAWWCRIDMQMNGFAMHAWKINGLKLLVKSAMHTGLQLGTVGNMRYIDNCKQRSNNCRNSKTLW